ncbi:MAG: hypothetical protein Q9165_001340 [Trypethelium subeluteriae]
MFIPSVLHVDALQTAIISVLARLPKVDEQTASPGSNVTKPALVSSITTAGKDGQTGVASRQDTRSRIAVLPLRTAQSLCRLLHHPDPTGTAGTIVTTRNESNQGNEVAPGSKSPTRNALGTEFWQSILSATGGRRTTSSGRLQPSPLRLHPIQEDDGGSSDDDTTSSAPSPDSFPIDEAGEDEEDEAEDAFVDAMDLVVEDGAAEGDYQMPAIPLRRFVRLEVEMDCEEKVNEKIGEKIGVPTRYQDVDLDLDLDLDPRLRHGGSDWR